MRTSLPARPPFLFFVFSNRLSTAGGSDRQGPTHLEKRQQHGAIKPQVRNPAMRHLTKTITRQSSATQSACVEHGVRERRGHPYQRATQAFSTPTPLLLSRFPNFYGHGFRTFFVTVCLYVGKRCHDRDALFEVHMLDFDVDQLKEYIFK